MAQKWLLAAGVMFLGVLEIWYELEAFQNPDDMGQVTLAFRVVSETLAPPSMTVAVLFGSQHYQMKLDSQGKATWSVPLQAIQDRHTQRFVAPVIVLLDDERGSC